MIVLAPFVSRESFELRVFSKKHLPYFEDTQLAAIHDIVLALQKALQKMEKKLRDPDYNFFYPYFVYSRKNKYRHYYWHIEILPKFSIFAGFEKGTGIEITTVDSDYTTKVLK